MAAKSPHQAKNKLPVFVKISNKDQLYHCFSLANIRNKLISPKKNQELKEDLILVQLRLFNTNTGKVKNTFSFLNMPLARSQDPNMVTLIEILTKMNAGASKTYLPFNKSILTRLIGN